MAFEPTSNMVLSDAACQGDVTLECDNNYWNISNYESSAELIVFSDRKLCRMKSPIA